MTSEEMIKDARQIVARLIVDCEMDNLDAVVSGVRALGALFGEPEEEKDDQSRAEDLQYQHPLVTAASNEPGPAK